MPHGLARTGSPRTKAFRSRAQRSPAGSVDRLVRDGVCGVVFVSGGMKLELEAVVSPGADEILFVWRVAER